MSLLALPPELLSSILELACVSSDPSSALRFSLVHPTLTPLAQLLLWRDVLLTSERQIDSTRLSPALERHGGHIRRLLFIPLDGDGGARGGVGRGIGTADTIGGEGATKLLKELKELWEQEQENGGGGTGIEELDIAYVDRFGLEVLEGEWLSGLRRLTVGTSFLLPIQRPPRPFTFSFRLASLSLHNNHWQSLAPELLRALLTPCAPRAELGEMEGSLQHLDLSATYDVDSFDPFLDPLSAVPYGEEDFNTSPPTVLSSLRTLRLPPFETSSHLSFAVSALSSCSAAHLFYIELPPLSAATSGAYDVLWAVLADLLSAGGVREVGLRGWPTSALVETARAVLAAAGMDTMPPTSLGAEAQRTGLRKLRFKRLLAVEEIGKVRPGGADLLEQAEAYGLEVACGDRGEAEEE
ncbi:hypothetical protein JCM10213_004930 [Rhodosporidiobolus nylandii]